jgi:lysozyme family protein
MAYVYNPERAAQLARRWDTMVITRQKPMIDYEAEEIIKHQAMYQQCQDVTGVHWAMIGVIDDREGGIENLGHRQLGQGDSLNAYSIHEPRGRPHVGHGPPFSWMECAIDALKLQGIIGKPVKTWTIEYMLHELEPYNGLAYYNHGRPSPYIWSCTSIYDPPTGPGGKITYDHGPIEHVVDKQSGVAPLLKRIGQMAKINYPRALEEDPVPVVPDLDVKWLQESLNKLDQAGLEVDGRYGPETTKAVHVFQQNHGLDVDGDAGPKTCAMIHSALSALG